MRVRVKICGITTPDAACAAADAGADAVGFVFAASARCVDPGTATELAELLPPFVTRVAVFRHPTESHVVEVVRQTRPDVVQAEPGDGIDAARRLQSHVLPVFHDGPHLVDQVAAYARAAGPAAALLLEGAGRGGRGVLPDWSRAARAARLVRLVLAGGLNQDNVADAIERVRPYGVDVSSGVESRAGRKDPIRIADFVRAVREADTVGGVTTP